MLVTFFRSSSYNAWDMCPHKYYLDYCLGFHSPAGKKADKGNVVHKALELLARQKLAEQQQEPSFHDDELGSFSVGIFPDEAIHIAWNHITKIYHTHDWNATDLVDCVKWMNEALNWREGMFSPMKREIVTPEQYFEFTIDEPWAKYDYTMPDGSTISGQLGLKGTIDLMVKQGRGLEMIDWKTGLRIDWSNFKPKTYESLMDDPQLRIYHYAASRLYPDVDNIFVTIFYLQAGGPESLCFTKKDLKRTEEMIKARFNTIRNTVRPRLVYPSKKCNWCWFKKNSFDGPTDDFSKSICQTVKNDIVTLGLDRAMVKHAKPGALDSYGSGGGRREKET